MSNYEEKQENAEIYYYNGREVSVIRYIYFAEMVIVKFLDNIEELRSVRCSCLETTDENYKSVKFTRVNEISKLF